MDLLRGLRRGVLAGAVGGLLAGAFGFGLAEPLMDRAVRLEAARTAAADARARAAGQAVAHHAEVFSRSTQHVGFVLATVATGVALGVLFGVLYAVLHRSGPDPNPWRGSVTLAAASWFGVFLVPFLRYPANPPGVGDPDTLGLRTNAYLSVLVIGIVGAVLAVRVWRRLPVRASLRELAVTGILVATVALTFLLPGNPDRLDVPAGLLWQFRLLALATSTLLWAGLGAAYGLLGERDRTRLIALQGAAVPA